MKKLFLSITLFAGVIAFALSAQATMLTFGLDCEFSEATPPEGPTPWITAIFDDSYGDGNTVRLTIAPVISQTMNTSMTGFSTSTMPLMSIC